MSGEPSRPTVTAVDGPRGPLSLPLAFGPCGVDVGRPRDGPARTSSLHRRGKGGSDPVRGAGGEKGGKRGESGGKGGKGGRVRAVGPCVRRRPRRTHKDEGRRSGAWGPFPRHPLPGRRRVSGGDVPRIGREEGVGVCVNYLSTVNYYYTHRHTHIHTHGHTYPPTHRP